MITKRIAYTRPDGGVSVVVPSPGARLVARIAMAGVGENVEFDPPVRLSNAFAAVGLGRGWSDEKIALADIQYAETESEFLAFIQRKDVPADAANTVVVDKFDLPVSRVFRNALRQNGAAIPVVDMPVARDIKTDIVRVERDLRLAAEDIAYMHADEQNDAAEKQRIATKKQVLRDLPSTIQGELNQQRTPEDLEAWQPTWPE